MPRSSSPDLNNVSKRQAALRRYHVLDTAPEKDFDRITSLVARVCNASTALITLIDEERQWFKSCFNFDVRQTDISVSFCVHAVHNGEMLVVEDATQDPRFKDNPIVTGPPHIRFYAGAPLTTPEGIHIGSLCIIDYEPKTFDAAQREILDRMADLVVNQFELRSAEAQVRQLVDENPQPMYVYAQSDGRIMKANSAAIEQYGYEVHDFASLTAEDLEAPAAHRDAASTLALHQHADGSYFPARVREREVLVDGHPAVLATVQPTPLHGPDSTFMVIDREGVVRSISQDTTKEGPLHDVIGTSFEELSNPFDRGAVSDALTTLMNGTRTVVSREIMIDSADGSRPYEAHLRSLRSAQGSIVGVSAMLVPPNEEVDVSVSESALDSSAQTLEAATDFASEPASETPPADEKDVEESDEKDLDDPDPVSASEPETEHASSESSEESEAPDTLYPEVEEQKSKEEKDEEQVVSQVPAQQTSSGDGTSDAPARPKAFSDTTASSLLRSLREREFGKDNDRSAPHGGDESDQESES